MCYRGSPCFVVVGRDERAGRNETIPSALPLQQATGVPLYPQRDQEGHCVFACADVVGSLIALCQPSRVVSSRCSYPRSAVLEPLEWQSAPAGIDGFRRLWYCIECGNAWSVWIEALL